MRPGSTAETAHIARSLPIRRGSDWYEKRITNASLYIRLWHACLGDGVFMHACRQKTGPQEYRGLTVIALNPRSVVRNQRGIIPVSQYCMKGGGRN